MRILPLLPFAVLRDLGEPCLDLLEERGMDHLTFAQLLGNHGEFVGAIAVGTLFYLALQVRHSKEATEASSRSIDAHRKVARAQIFHAISA